MKDPLSRIFRTWWPLAASWLFMAAELPALSAVIARLPQPDINLAAYGGIVFPLALIIESPVIMLLAASTALSRDWASYARLRIYMMLMGASLTALHALIAFTPLYDLVVVQILHPPPEIVEPARIGLMIMLPWTWSIAYRRFHQGVLIRFNRPRTVWIGTGIRLAADLLVLLVGYSIQTIPGIVVATLAVSAGVISEAAYVGLAVRPILRGELRRAPKVEQVVTLNSFMTFYIPLVMTSLLSMLIQPMGSAALGRMPQALQSLAAWPVVNGLVFMLRSMGIAYNEVVVAMLDEPGMAKKLKQFTIIMASATTGLHLLVAATPLTELWFFNVSALPTELADLARVAFWLALPMPGLSAFQSWYQGAILHGRHTRHITESVILFLLLAFALLAAAVLWGNFPGLYAGMGAFVLATGVQTAWLWWRSRGVIRELSKTELSDD